MLSTVGISYTEITKTNKNNAKLMTCDLHLSNSNVFRFAITVQPMCSCLLDTTIRIHTEGDIQLC